MYGVLTTDAWTGPIEGEPPKLPGVVTLAEHQAAAGRGNRGKPKAPEHAAKLRAAAARATAAHKANAAARRTANDQR